MIQTLINADGNTLLVVSVQDLREFVKYLVESNECNRPSDENTATLSSKEVCNFLHIKDTSLWKLCKAGKLSFTKIGRKRVFKASDVQALINR